MADETSPWELRLYTERLCLRVPTSQDAEDLYDLFARPLIFTSGVALALFDLVALLPGNPVVDGAN